MNENGMPRRRFLATGTVLAMIPLICAPGLSVAATNASLRTSLKYQGKPFLGFLANKNHIGIYPYSGQVVETLKDELQGFGLSSGAIRVPLDRPISEELLNRVIDCRLEQIREQRRK